MARRSCIALVAAAAVGLVGVSAPTAEAQAKGDPAAGHVLYHARCARCHGPTGGGDGPVAPRLAQKPQDWTKGLNDMTDQQVADSITKGGPAVGKSNAMLAFPRLSDAEVWNLVAYIRTLAKKP